jgi:hypothetical protein
MTVLTLEQPATTWTGFTYATPRNPERRSHGAGIALIADQLGKSGMPWQRYVWDVATEVDGNGDYVYEIVLVTVPRQSGKTTLFGPVQIHRALTMRSVKTFYTAQTGKDARSRFNDLWQLIEGSPLAPRATLRRSAGDEGIRWAVTGSQNKIFAPVEAALHGETPPLVGMDEIWEFDELLGDALLEGAIIPAQITLAGRRQIWLMSTAGTAASVFMRKWVERGRQSVLDPGSHPRLAYFEASLPDGEDPFDPRALARFHPAVGHTQTIDSLMEISRQVSRATWLRAFCNIWTEAADPLIPPAEWDELADPQLAARWSDVAISWEVAYDNEMGAILASWRDENGHPRTRVVHAAPGTQWMVELLVEIHKRGPAAFGADDGGPTRRITDEVRRRVGEDAVTTLTAKDFGVACATWLTAARDERTLIHDGSQTLSNGVAYLVFKRVGEVDRFSRTDAAGPVAAPVASAVALWLYDHKPAPGWAPVTRY